MKHENKTGARRHYLRLACAPEGRYRCRPWWAFWRRGGWLTVSREDGQTTVMWTSGNEFHLPIYGNALAVDVDSAGNLTAFYESAITMWMQWGHGRGSESDRKQGEDVAAWMDSVLSMNADHNKQLAKAAGRSER